MLFPRGLFIKKEVVEPCCCYDSIWLTIYVLFIVCIQDGTPRSQQSNTLRNRTCDFQGEVNTLPLLSLAG